MKYSQTRANEAVSLIGTAIDKSSGKEKRRAQRREIRTTINIITTLECKAELCDLSARGARLVVNNPLPVGTQFVLDLPSKPGAQRDPIICRVVHCKSVGIHGFSIGAEFVGSLQSPENSPEGNAQSDRIRASILR